MCYDWIWFICECKYSFVCYISESRKQTKSAFYFPLKWETVCTAGDTLKGHFMRFCTTNYTFTKNYKRSLHKLSNKKNFLPSEKYKNVSNRPLVDKIYTKNKKLCLTFSRKISFNTFTHLHQILSDSSDLRFSQLQKQINKKKLIKVHNDVKRAALKKIKK